MPFSQDIKDFLNEKIKKSAVCCSAAFHAAVNAMPPFLLDECCTSSYLAGIFCAFGTATEPSKRFHLSITAPAEIAEDVYDLFPDWIKPLRTVRKGKTVFYYGSSAGIEDFLTYIGACKFSLEVMRNTVLKNVRSESNRLSNAEYANIARSTAASASVTSAIAILRKASAFDKLPPELIETAKMREKYPDLSLKDLCLCFSPPLSKSGLSHRLKRIVQAAEKYTDTE